jgi:cytochrome c-type biogenesis protein
MSAISNIGILTAFAAGLISFLSPCVLPLVPGYVSYVAGESIADADEGSIGTWARLRTLGLSFNFVLGFSTAFVLLGATATALGQLLLRYRYELNIASGIIVILFGLFVTGLLRWSWMMRDVRLHAAIEGGRPLSAYILGLAFAFGWTPCIGPILGAILTVSAATTTVLGGVVLLAIYSLGLGVPFLLTAMFTDVISHRLKSARRLGRWLQVLAGAAMVLMGIAMVTGQMSVMAYWFLNAFPILARIG